METPAGTRLWDISPPLTADLAVFPGDTPLSREVLLRRDSGDSVTLSTLHATVHLGAHVDAPLHYGTGAGGIDTVPLDRLLGRCRLIRPGGGGRTVTPEDLPPLADGVASRVLVATGSHEDPNRWTDGFRALAPGTVAMLAAAGVRTIGVDTPSVDPAESAELPAHTACLAHDVTILEGLRLDGVPDGEYELIALPLRLVGFDGSPVRAVLREIGRNPA